MLAICEVCGAEMQIGQWPFCKGDPAAHAFGNNLQKPMEPYTDEMLSSSPIEFRTIGEKVRYMDKHNLVPKGEYRKPAASMPLRDGEIRSAIRDTIRELRR